MNIEALIDDLVGHGVELWLDGERLRCRGPEEEVIPELYASLRAHKDQVASLLRQQRNQRPSETLSYSQQSLWLLHQLAPNSAAYNVNAVIPLAAPRLPALEAAVAAIVDRHATLRTVYDVEHGKPVQRVLPRLSVPVQLVPLETWEPAAVESAITREVDAPFDLRERPLRVSLLSAPGQSSALLVITVHHIATDYWSLQLLLSELQTAYRAAARGAPTALPPVAPFAYIDHARRERARLAGEESAALWTFWSKELAGELPVLDLPLDRPRPALQTYVGTTLTRTLTAELGAAVESAARAHGVTPFVLMLTVFELLLSRYTAQTDLLIGLPVSTRGRRGSESVVGNFVNMLPLRVDLGGDASFAVLLGRVRERTLAALDHRDMPFALLVERLAPEREHTRAPLFQVVYNWNRPDGAARDAAPAEALQGSSTGRSGAPYDLTLTVTAAGAHVSCGWNYNIALFDRDTIEHMADAYLCLLRSAIQQPDVPVSRLALLDDHERRRLVSWHDRRVANPGELVAVHTSLSACARREPDAIAVRCGEASLSYGQLAARSDALAAELCRRGVARQMRVGLYATRSIELVVGMIAILKAGAVYVPLERSFPVARLRTIALDAELRAIVGEAGPLTEAMPELELISPLQSDSPGSPFQPPALAPADLAYLIYTSGSSGQPKGVCISHRALAGFAQAMGEAIAIAPGDRVLATTTVAFDISLLELLVPLTIGACVVIATVEPALDPEGLLAEVEAQRVNVAQATPSGWQLLLDSGARRAGPLRMLCGGEALSEDLARRLLGTGGELWNVYGPTEATVWVGAQRVGLNAHAEERAGAGPDPGSAMSVPIGGPLRHTAWYVLDAQLEPVPLGMPGELCIAGPCVASGYWNRPELSARQFVASPFDGDRMYKTGDRVRQLPDGRIQYLGRVDQQLKIRGFRIEPGEVEAVLRSLPSIREALVTVRGTRARPLLVGYVVAAEGARIHEAQLRESIRERLPEYMVPAFLIEIDRVPLKPSGKIDHGALPEPDVSKHIAVGAYVAPESETERWLCEVWAEVLGIDSAAIGLDHNFFELGGHSLRLVAVLERVKARAPQELPLVELYRYPTIRALARHLDGAPEPASAAVREPTERAALRKAALQQRKPRAQKS